MSLRRYLPTGSHTALARSPDGVWIGTTRGLAHWEDGKWRGVALPRELNTNLVSSILSTRDAEGRENLWVGTPNGVAIRRAGQWRIADRTVAQR